jgi:hypothetical protein
MYVYVSRKRIGESVKQTPQHNTKAKLIKADDNVKQFEVDEASVTNTLEEISAAIKSRRERKHKPMKEWNSLFQPKGENK